MPGVLVVAGMASAILLASDTKKSAGGGQLTVALLSGVATRVDDCPFNASFSRHC
jgi:hypothetical protein